MIVVMVLHMMVLLHSNVFRMFFSKVHSYNSDFQLYLVDDKRPACIDWPCPHSSWLFARSKVNICTNHPICVQQSHARCMVRVVHQLKNQSRWILLTSKPGSTWPCPTTNIEIRNETSISSSSSLHEAIATDGWSQFLDQDEAKLQVPLCWYRLAEKNCIFQAQRLMTWINSHRCQLSANKVSIDCLTRQLYGGPAAKRIAWAP